MICPRCLKSLPDKPDGASIHTCTPSKLVRELEQQRDELLAALILANANSREPVDEPWRAVVRSAIAKVNLLHSLPSTELREPPREAFK